MDKKMTLFKERTYVWNLIHSAFSQDKELKNKKSRNNKLLIISIFIIMGIGILLFNNYTGSVIKINNETVVKDIILYTTDKNAYAPEFLLDEGKVSVNPINLEDVPIYRYLKIRNQPDLENIESIKIEFRVEKEWVKSYSLSKEDITLYEYMYDKWKPMFTEFKSEDDDKYYYSSKVSSINEFAIGTAVSGEKINIIPIKPRLVKGTSIYLSFIKDNKVLVYYFLILLFIESLLILAPGLIKKTSKKLLSNRGAFIIVLLVLFAIIYYLFRLFFSGDITGAVAGVSKNNSYLGIILLLILALFYSFNRIIKKSNRVKLDNYKRIFTKRFSPIYKKLLNNYKEVIIFLMILLTIMVLSKLLSSITGAIIGPISPEYGILLDITIIMVILMINYFFRRT